MTNKTNEQEDKHLTMEDGPFQKPASKELADAIDKALGIERNKPVAWMQTYKGEPNNIAWTKKDLEELGESIEYGYVPLHPLKELSDEEIIETHEEWIKSYLKEDYSPPTPEERLRIIEIHRAVLKKARE